MKLNLDAGDTEKLIKQLDKIPGMMRHAVASTLNTQAFGMRNEFIPESLDELFTVRNPAFLKRQTRVKMARKGADPNVNFSEVGMMDAPRFTGLEEQQIGKAPEKKRTATIDVARSGSFAKKQKPSTRMNKTFRRQSEYRGRSKKHRMFQMFRETRKQKLNMLINRSDANIFGMPAGLYGWHGGKLKMLQSFEPPKPHKADWMGRALKKLYRKQGPQFKVFERELERIFRGF